MGKYPQTSQLQHITMVATVLTAILAASIGLTEAAPHPHKYYGHGYGYPLDYPMIYRPRLVYKYHKAMPAMMEPAPRADLGDVVDVAVGAGSFTTLVKIVSDLGLVDTLKGSEALTIFAPSDDAFAKLPPGTLESLTPDQAKAIILRHVVTAKVPAAAVATGPVGTIGGEEIGLVKTAEGGVQINYNGNTQNVVTADVMASNGVIHVIDSVIL